MTRTKYGYILTAAAVAFLSLAGCNDSSSISEPISTTQTGSFSLGISDGPIHDALKVCIKFNEIEFKGAGQTTLVTLDPAETVNLLDFQGANAAPILVGESLPAGNYEWLRLGIDAVVGGMGGMGADTAVTGCVGAGSYILMKDSNVYNLYVPSGAETGLKLVGGFTVPVNGSADFTADFDLMQSITSPPGLAQDGLVQDVVLRPTIRLLDNTEVGTLTGQVSNELAIAAACAAPSVYVFDDGVEPNAIDTGEVADPEDPVATALVNDRSNDDGTTSYHYSVGFLLAGDYEVAFTCDGAIFEPALGNPANIAAQQVTTVDFP